MSIIIGELDEYIDDEDRCFIGVIVAFDKEIKIRLLPTGNENPKAPTHSILAVGKAYEPQIGSAWLKKPNKPDSKIQEYFSITIEDPGFASALNVAAFPKGNGKWDISWRRRQTSTPKEAA
jgi:uncharacterized protein (DUF736 family)